MDFLTLTVCRDLTNTPTSCYLIKDIIKHLSDSEIAILINTQAKFISGKNISIVKSKIKDLVNFDLDWGFVFHLDFRIDTDAGIRMLPTKEHDSAIIGKLRDIIAKCKPIYSPSQIGTFTIIANYKVLHARAIMNISETMAKQIAHNCELRTTPRLLFRSKGNKYNISI